MRIGIIGGTGVYDLEFLEEVKEVKVTTPFGKPSDKLIIGKMKGSENEIVFLPRHGKGHLYNPSNVNYRANIAAMKKVGVREIIAPAAVGSLNDKIKPGDIVFPDQLIDRTYARKITFYDGKIKVNGKSVCHVSFAYPFCERLRKILIESAKDENIKFHSKATCVVIEGPRFSTKAESNLYRSWKCDIINMTMYPECVLAREAEICYASIAMVTDYDCWKEHIVDTEMIIETMKRNIEKVKKIIMNATKRMKDEDCSCKHALENAFV
jgi:5'-methylthioadenosine phosphorylase